MLDLPDPGVADERFARLFQLNPDAVFVYNVEQRTFLEVNDSIASTLSDPQVANDLRTAAALADLLRVFEVAPVDGDVLQSALAIPGPDFEDAVQIAAAIAAGATHLVTRNPADFQACPIPILQPAELIALIAAT